MILEICFHAFLETYSATSNIFPKSFTLLFPTQLHIDIFYKLIHCNIRDSNDD